MRLRAAARAKRTERGPQLARWSAFAGIAIAASIASAQTKPSAVPPKAATSAKASPSASPSASASASVVSAPAASPKVAEMVAPLPPDSATPPTGDQVAKGRTLFDLGVKAYEAENFAAALQAFDEAYKLARRPGIIFSMAQAHRRIFGRDRTARNLRLAVAYYREYIVRQKSGGRISEAKQALAELEPQVAALPAEVETSTAVASVGVEPKPLARLMVSSPTKTALASLDGGEPTEMPLIEELTPGKHHLRIQADGYIADEREIMAPDSGVVGLDVSLRERPSVLTITAEAGADVAIDGRTVGRTPLPRGIEVPSGKRLVTVLLSGYRPYSAEVELKRDEKKTLDVHLDRTTQRYASYVTFGAGLGGAAVAGVFAGLAAYQHNVARKLDDQRIATGISDAELAEYTRAKGQYEDNRRIAIGAAAAGVTVMGVGVALYLFDRPTPGMTTYTGSGGSNVGTRRAPVLPYPIVGDGLYGGGLLIRF